jgi:fatty acid desaturase
MTPSVREAGTRQRPAPAQMRPRPEPVDRPYPVAYGAPAEVRDQLHEFQATSLPRSLAAVVADHAAIFGLLAGTLAAYSALPLAAAIAVNVVVLVGVARFQRGLECLVHEASHYNWTRRRRLNDVLANSLAALPVFSTVQEYRVGHFIHHRKKGTADDPDLRRYVELDVEGLDRTSALRYWLGVARRLPRYTLGWWSAIQASRRTALEGLAWHLLVVVLAGTLVVGPTWSLLVWGQWMAAFAFVLPVLRFVGEAGEHHYVGTGTVFEATMVNDGPVHHLLIHPHGDSYHLVHHLWPSVPHHRIRRLHKLLVELDPEGYAGRVRRRTRILEEPPLRAPREVRGARRARRTRRPPARVVVGNGGRHGTED